MNQVPPIANSQSSRFRLRLINALALDEPPSFDGDLDAPAPLIRPKSEAAVMMLFQSYGGEPRLVLTKRADALREHSGQVAFPGGRLDAEDADLWSAALRETCEEIGLPASHPVERLGQMSRHLTVTGYSVTPFAAWNETPFEYKAEAGEVAEVFEVPASVIKPENFEIGHAVWQGRKRSYWVLPYEDYFIWGATARMLRQLAVRLENAG